MERYFMNKFIKSTVFLAFVAFGGSVLFSCKGTGNKVDGQAANDSVQVADTLSADSDIGQHLRDTPAAQYPLPKG